MLLEIGGRVQRVVGAHDLILALVVMARRASYPHALMKPYRKGER